MSEHVHPSAGGYERADRKRLGIALALTIAGFVAEIAGGFLSNSLALLSDAAHLFTDGLGLSFALLAATWAARPATREKSFGLYRAEVLAALANGMLLLGVVGRISWEALGRFQNPSPIVLKTMLGIGALGLFINVVAALLLARGRHGNVNVRGAFLHVIGDALGSVAVLGGGGAAWALDDPRADAVASLLIAVLVLWSAVGLLRESFHVLMEGSPESYREIEEALRSEPEIKSVHDVHVWSLTPGVEALTAHLVIPAGGGDTDGMLERCERMLRERFGIRHTTLQIERADRCTAENPQAGCPLEKAN
ncbi:MAG: cation diffusion facilitator family transporter [Bdellovibrionota bacterium]